MINSILIKQISCALLIAILCSSAHTKTPPDLLTTPTLKIPSELLPTCPEPNFEAQKYTIEPDPTDPEFVDHNRELKDLGTMFVVREFFSSKETLFNFMKLVYTTLDKALTEYKKQNNLEDRALFILGKGGNYLRMVAQRFWNDLLNPDARNILKEFYSPYFKRSDADFSVYLDQDKLGDKNYDQVLDEVTKLMHQKLNIIRKEFQKNTHIYFDFSRFGPQYSSTVLKKYFDKLGTLESTQDEDNPNWFQAVFFQLQLGNNRALKEPICTYVGTHDYKFTREDNKTIGTPISDQPNWIVNSDNRTLEWSTGDAPEEKAKFYLVRAKVNLEYYITQNNQTKRVPIGGELIDVSLPHREELGLKDFFANYENAVQEYSLSYINNNDNKEVFNFKAYSLEELAEDLRIILFKDNERPWDSGPKYVKRLNRHFLLSIIELAYTYGLGTSDISNYTQKIKTGVLAPLRNLFPITENYQKVLSQLGKALYNHDPDLSLNHELFKEIALLVQRMINKTEEEDQEDFSKFLDMLEENLETIQKLTNVSEQKINIEDLFELNIENLL